ncbi:DnAJ-like protein [Diplonema papillatum]|nr:DnAJ-like protein [Diplonema papillatum]
MPAIEEDLYKALGLRATASVEDIKKAYKKLALEHHPDRCGDSEKFKIIACAYEVLGDPRQRYRYDETKRQQAGSNTTAAPRGEPRSNEVRPSRTVREAFRCECLDGLIRTFDVDPTAFPVSLTHGDHIIVGGDTGVLVGVAEEAVWWWKNGCNLPSRLGSFAQFNHASNDINKLQWRRTGNLFQNAAARTRVVDLERRRLDSLRKYKNKQREKEKQDAKAKKSEAQHKKATAALASVVNKEQKRRHTLELTMLLELTEVITRAAFVNRVTSYWTEAKIVMTNLLNETRERCHQFGSSDPMMPRLRSSVRQMLFDEVTPAASRPVSARCVPSRDALSNTCNSLYEQPELASSTEDLVQSAFDDMLTRPADTPSNATRVLSFVKAPKPAAKSPRARSPLQPRNDNAATVRSSTSASPTAKLRFMRCHSASLARAGEAASPLSASCTAPPKVQAQARKLHKAQSQKGLRRVPSQTPNSALRSQSNIPSPVAAKKVKREASLGASVSWKPPPPLVEFEDSSETSTTTEFDTSTDSDVEKSWQSSDKLFSSYKAYLANSRVLQESWEKGSHLINQLGKSKLRGLDTSTRSMTEILVNGEAPKQAPQGPSHTAKRANRRGSGNATSTSGSASSGKEASSPKMLRKESEYSTRTKRSERAGGLRPCSPGTFTAGEY